MAPKSSPVEVIIIGAGLGGLACAIACGRQGLKPIVLERADEIGAIGAGIQIPPNAARVLDGFGLLTKIKTKATVLEALDIRRFEDGEIVASKPLTDEFIRTIGQSWMVIHREDYHAILLEEAKRLGADIRLSQKIASINVRETKICMENGQLISGHVIIGADGLWSMTRTSILETPADPKETGDLAFRGTFSRKQLLELGDPRIDVLCNKRAVTLWLGPEKHVVFYPVRSGQEFNLVLLRPDNLPNGTRTRPGDIEEMKTTFKGWDSVLTKIITCIPSVLKWKLCHLDELQKWKNNYTVLLGDACHPTLPYQAQGAAMAIEDGAVLGYLLGKLNERFTDSAEYENSPDAIRGVLELYEQLRKARTTVNTKGAVANRAMYHLPDGKAQQERDEELRNFDYTNGRSDIKWADSVYQRDMLGFDAVGNAKLAFAIWCREVPEMKLVVGRSKNQLLKY